MNIKVALLWDRWEDSKFKVIVYLQTHSRMSCRSFLPVVSHLRQSKVRSNRLASRLHRGFLLLLFHFYGPWVLTISQGSNVEDDAGIPVFQMPGASYVHRVAGI